jgi:hypothetical protein
MMREVSRGGWGIEATKPFFRSAQAAIELDFDQLMALLGLNTQ